MQSSFSSFQFFAHPIIFWKIGVLWQISGCQYFRKDPWLLYRARPSICYTIPSHSQLHLFVCRVMCLFFQLFILFFGQVVAGPSSQALASRCHISSSAHHTFPPIFSHYPWPRLRHRHFAHLNFRFVIILAVFCYLRPFRRKVDHFLILRNQDEWSFPTFPSQL